MMTTISLADEGLWVVEELSGRSLTPLALALSPSTLLLSVSI
jgi:hypothetical protein